jgi:DNA processing protein
VIVVEAAAKSGSLTTARFALDQGREVMAVPGHPFDSRASGCNMLIRDGAMLVRSAQDVVQALDHVGGPAAQPLTEPAEEPRKLADMSALHRQILDRLGPSPLAEDQLIRDLQIPAGEVGPELLNLELEGRIERRAGGLLSLRVN